MLGGRQWRGVSISGIPAEFSEVTQAKVIVHLLKEQRRAVGDESKQLGLSSEKTDAPCPADCPALTLHTAWENKHNLWKAW